jgi:hypothetical protein
MQPTAGDFEDIKRRTEAVWADAPIDPTIHGFQIQPGTRWNPGLSPDQIGAYERALGVRFSASFRCMLSVMNGTDLPAINVYGSSGHPVHEGPGVYSYPRDLAFVKAMIAHVQPDRTRIEEVLAEQGFRLTSGDGLVPIYSHRFLVCGADSLDGAVLSIWGTDAIVYGRTLVEYLYADLFEADQLRAMGRTA